LGNSHFYGARPKKKAIPAPHAQPLPKYKNECNLMVIIPIHKDYNKKMPIQTSKTAIFASHNVISRVGQNIESIL
jgi:hypothetical protein